MYDRNMLVYFLLGYDTEFLRKKNFQILHCNMETLFRSDENIYIALRLYVHYITLWKIYAGQYIANVIRISQVVQNI